MDNEDKLDITTKEIGEDLNMATDSQNEEITFKEYNTSSNSNIVGDDQVFYNPESVDELNTTIQKMYKDFYNWLRDIEAVDELFDSVISPYIKGSPPHDKRFIVLIKKYISKLDDAKKVFDDTLTEIIDYIDDYSKNKTLTVNETSEVKSRVNRTSDFTSDGDIDKTIDNYDVDRNNSGGQGANTLVEDDLDLEIDASSQVETNATNGATISADTETLEVNDNTMDRLYDDNEDKETSEVSE